MDRPRSFPRHRPVEDGPVSGGQGEGKPPKTKALCRGCYNDFYNGRQNFSQFGCWSYGKAKVVKRAFVHIDQVPPWNNPLEYTLSCHNRQRYVSVEPGDKNLADGPQQGSSNAIHGVGHHGPSSLLPKSPAGGLHFVLSVRDAVEMLVDPVVESVWQLVQHDHRASADLLLEIADALIEHSERDRKRAIEKARETP